MDMSSVKIYELQIIEFKKFQNETVRWDRTADDDDYSAIAVRNIYGKYFFFFEKKKIRVLFDLLQELTQAITIGILLFRAFISI